MLILKRRWWSIFYPWKVTTYDIYKNVATLYDYRLMNYTVNDDVYGLDEGCEEFLRSLKGFRFFRYFTGAKFIISFAQTHTYGLRMIACQGVTWVGDNPPTILFHRKRDAIRFAVRYGRLRDPSYSPRERSIA